MSSKHPTFSQVLNSSAKYFHNWYRVRVVLYFKYPEYVAGFLYMSAGFLTLHSEDL